MRLVPSVKTIRELVRRTFAELGADADEVADVGETILLDRGRYVARTYRTAALMAMWLIEVGLVQFYDAEGNMLRSISLFDEARPQRMAA
jgi:hypothetical protein